MTHLRELFKHLVRNASRYRDITLLVILILSILTAAVSLPLRTEQIEHRVTKLEEHMDSLYISIRELKRLVSTQLCLSMSEKSKGNWEECLSRWGMTNGKRSF